jgi:hypothetical protein
MLQIGINHHDGVAPRIVEAGSKRYLFTEVPTEIDDTDCRIDGLQRA